MKIIRLTEEQFRVLRHHWKNNIGFGVGGTFGDGEDFMDRYGRKSKCDYRIAKEIEQQLDALAQ